ncbi:hypothetical protein JDV02_000196 [Purpureocillium takamizusanense]|uniref:Uncharacterized protein n=1 Tax=Purpureocillium takamizusanense TaxID=2060973 RepID=A0A9Q8Q5M7_9HYPO|nr:uncharacterized protein JDV02_000196 [Purpureocillium takamizusanense]UNI13450.1 hypothetical protein JDV02_000196 [Purpureocillium takamizusanense]
MATADYIVRVENHSKGYQNYVFLNDPPALEVGSGAKPKVWPIVWQSNGSAPNSGSVQFTAKAANYAAAGTVKKVLDNNVKVISTIALNVEVKSAVKVGTKAAMELDGSGTPKFNPPYDAVAADSSFAIKTRPYDSITYRNIYCGYGKDDGGGGVTPVAGFMAQPEQLYQITPSLKYFVGVGDQYPGTAVDIDTLEGREIDFTTAKPGQTIATVIQHDDDSFSEPKFSYP